MTVRLRTLCTAVLVLITSSTALFAEDAIDLMTVARQREQWVDEVERFYIRLEGGWVAFADQKPDHLETCEIAFDAQRVARRREKADARCDVRVWDGTQATSMHGDSFDAPTSYVFDDEPDGMFDHNFLNDMGWLRIGGHSFWWRPVDAGRSGDSFWGAIEEYKIVGRERFRGIECHVLEGHGGFRRCWIGVGTGFLHGFVVRVLTEDADARSVIDAIAERYGQRFDDTRDFYRWKYDQPRNERIAMDREYFEKLRPTSRPQTEHFLLDWTELEPGRWVPMTQGYHFFDREPRADGTYGFTSERTLRVTEIQIGEPFPAERFTIELQKGVEVTDRRYDVMLNYRYDPDMSEERWNEILTKSRSRWEVHDTQERARDELVGGPAPPFPATTWLNSEPLSWEDLRGQVVILDFWAEWCGACRRDFPEAASLHRDRGKRGIKVIGIHTAGSELAKIENVMAEFKMEYPTVIDVPPPAGARAWGALYDAYRVYGIPHAFLVDSKGRVAAHGSLRQMIGRARTLPRPERDDG